MKLEGDVSIGSIIHKITTLSNGKWVSASGFHISVAGGILGIAGLFLATRETQLRTLGSFRWSLSHTDDSLEEFWVVPGLQNLGNNCFLNVILQALASCSSFRFFLRKIINECGSSLVEGCSQGLSLTVALDSLLKELCIVRHGGTVLTPRKVMLAMDHYLPGFQLTSQQDAEEALLHLLSSLREECFECYDPNYGSLADAIAVSNYKIHTLERRLNHSEQERWHQCFLGPFDGILGSILNCQSCSFQISLDFEFFHSLHLSPVLSNGATIMPGCTVEDCLKKFIVAEKLDHYRCSRCWHIAAIKYLSSTGGDETDIEKLRSCREQDSCECKNFFGLERLPWSNSYSHTFKQLSITRCPKILCIHLQRASLNGFGELVKLQGHISFPLVWDVSPFISNGVGIREWGDNSQRWQAKERYKHSLPHTKSLNMQFDTSMLNSIYGQKGDINTHLQSFREEPNLPQIEACSNTTCDDVQMQAEDEVLDTCDSSPRDLRMYRLVSVVEHFGKTGSGHYTVYRRARPESCGENSNVQSEHGDDVRWFCISDSQVRNVSEKDVLAAEASLLFYEEIVE